MHMDLCYRQSSFTQQVTLLCTVWEVGEREWSREGRKKEGEEGHSGGEVFMTKTLCPQCSTHIHELINCHDNDKLERAIRQYNNEP